MDAYYKMFENTKDTDIQQQVRRVKWKLFCYDFETGIYDHLYMLASTVPYLGGEADFSIN